MEDLYTKKGDGISWPNGMTNDTWNRTRLKDISYLLNGFI